jgi:Type I restriction-modification system methyltransferase subunit
MLDTDTKRRIDTARDILVGKIPSPTSQVEQITIALIYKFMDDMDNQAEELGGERTFFSGEFARYGWAKLMDVSLGGQEVLNRYAEAIEKMKENKNLPLLFRDIFKNAFLPYRDPETLKSFLKEINSFTYDHSERLGDAFEYLLLIMGSQGEAGQFITPRHIIDFMVRLVDPQKGESILDPACGTAGFLISAFKHIFVANIKDGTPGGALTPDERTRLMDAIEGYDISPDMVRLSLVNLYLHGFTTPKIHEYDTLTNEERWNNAVDVILANPPFMSPKGGIRPHKRFAISSNRSEVLFVDYIMEHLTSNGRAAVIVPEGVIFKSDKAYKELRKRLIENSYLVGVISLPAGVFNPYSGVKTSILWIDRALARQTDQIIFCKIEHDGFDLGAQRRPNGKNDLPEILTALTGFKTHIANGNIFAVESFSHYSLVEKKKIVEGGEYNLSSERYLNLHKKNNGKYQYIEIGTLCEFKYGKPLKEEVRKEGNVPVFGSNGIVGFHNEYLVKAPFIIVGRKGSAGEVHYSEVDGYPIDTTFYIDSVNEEVIKLKFLFQILKYLNLKNTNIQSGVPGLNRNDVYKILIPTPPLEIQEEIIAEINEYQKIIDGARMVVENYHPRIEVDPSWPMVKLGDVCEKITDGTRIILKMESHFLECPIFLNQIPIRNIYQKQSMKN